MKKETLKPVEEIGSELGADSLAYTSIESLIEAIGFDTCRGCIDFPDGYPSEWKKDVIEMFKKIKKVNVPIMSVVVGS